MTPKTNLVRRQYVSTRLLNVMLAYKWNVTQAGARFGVTERTIQHWTASESRMTEVHLRKLERFERQVAKRVEKATRG